ncbi:MAG: hypothetical protein ANABAC_2691 [Anaerolineae bacterium]|jgi:hypothetical protein|nr:MAG: hypothetical protein ANABAC_2691 [Anaerolineae bacterium]
MRKRWTGFLLTLLLLLLAGGLLVWTFARVHWSEVWLALRSLHLWQISIWMLVNLLILILLNLRWWFLLRLQGVKVPFFSIFIYRLAGFGLSYLTPGPQFGGEGWLVLLLRRRHGVSFMEGSISVAIDKLIELLANFSFLAFGLLVSLQVGVPNTILSTVLTLPLIGLLSAPFLLFGLLAKGILPASWLAKRWQQPPRLLLKLLQVLSDAEQRSASLIRQKLWLLIAVYLYSLGIWLVLLGEFWLMLHFLGIDVGFRQTVFTLTAARLAFLTPLPGGLGALEAAQVAAVQGLGFSAALGLSLSLLQRGRDLLLASLGIAFGSLLHLRPLFPSRETAGSEVFLPSPSLSLQERDP